MLILLEYKSVYLKPRGMPYFCMYSKASFIWTGKEREKCLNYQKVRINEWFQRTAKSRAHGSKFIMWELGQWPSAFAMKTTSKRLVHSFLRCFTAYVHTVGKAVTPQIFVRCVPCACMPRTALHPGIKKGHAFPCALRWLTSPLALTEFRAANIKACRGAAQSSNH